MSLVKTAAFSKTGINNKRGYVYLCGGTVTRRVRHRLKREIVCGFSRGRGSSLADEVAPELPYIPAPYSAEDWDIPIDERMRQTVQACKPDIYQQTLIRSFVVGGVGLHSGEYSIIRVRPAFALEGRYFVRVPEGTNEKYSSQMLDPAYEEEMQEMEVSPERQEMITRLFAFYSGDQQEYGYDGTFEDWLEANELMHYKPEKLERMWHQNYEYFEEVKPREEDEIIVPATIDYACHPPTLQVNVGNEGVQVCSIEHLMAALEVCGVDNARIEIEGGEEVPVFDGSALGWVQEIYKCGLRPAAQEGQDENILTPKLYFNPTQPVQVNALGAHITYAPDLLFKCTYGIDVTGESEIIGKQWYHWDMFTDKPFYSEIAPARDWIASMHALYSLYELGYYRGGTEGTTIIAHKDNYLHPDMLRYPFDECARHRLIDLMGDLALLGKQGHGGIPMGHITAFNGTHELHHTFLMELAKQLDSSNLQMYFPQGDDDLVMQQAKLTDDQIQQILSWKYVVKQRRLEIEGLEEQYQALEDKYTEKIMRGEEFMKIRDDLIKETEVAVNHEGNIVIPDEITRNVQAAKEMNPAELGDGEYEWGEVDEMDEQAEEEEEQEGELEDQLGEEDVIGEEEVFEEGDEEEIFDEGEEEDFDPEMEAELMEEYEDDSEEEDYIDVESRDVDDEQEK